MSTGLHVFDGRLTSSTQAYTSASGVLMVAMALLAIAVIIVAGSWALSDPAGFVQTFDGIVAP